MTEGTPRRRHWEQYRTESKKYIDLIDSLLDSTSNLSIEEAQEALEKLQKVQQALELKLCDSGKN